MKLKVGDIIRNNELKVCLPGIPDFKPAFYKVTGIRDGYFSQNLKPEDRPVYELTLCTSKGKLFKTTHPIRCRSIDFDIDKGTITRQEESQ